MTLADGLQINWRCSVSEARTKGKQLFFTLFLLHFSSAFRSVRCFSLLSSSGGDVFGPRCYCDCKTPFFYSLSLFCHPAVSRPGRPKAPNIIKYYSRLNCEACGRAR